MDFQMTSPVFSKVTIKLNPAYYPGKTFVIAAKNTDANNFIVDSMKLNDRPHSKFRITHGDIVKGGRLDFILKSEK
jgi:putative alpha-1,2-mannosidase